MRESVREAHNGGELTVQEADAVARYSHSDRPPTRDTYQLDGSRGPAARVPPLAFDPPDHRFWRDRLSESLGVNAARRYEDAIRTGLSLQNPTSET